LRNAAKNAPEREKTTKLAKLLCNTVGVVTDVVVERSNEDERSLDGVGEKRERVTEAHAQGRNTT